MTLEGKDKNGIWIVSTFIMMPLGLFTVYLGISQFLKFDYPIIAFFIFVSGLFLFFYGLFIGKENKYYVEIQKDYLLYKQYPFFIDKKLFFEDINGIIITVSKQGVYGDFNGLMISKKGFKKSIYFSSYSIIKEADFDLFVNELSLKTNIKPTQKVLNEFQKAIRMIFK